MGFLCLTWSLSQNFIMPPAAAKSFGSLRLHNTALAIASSHEKINIDGQMEQLICVCSFCFNHYLFK